MSNLPCKTNCKLNPPIPCEEIQYHWEKKGDFCKIHLDIQEQLAETISELWKKKLEVQQEYLKKQLITIIDYQHVSHNPKEELKRVMHYTIKYIKNPEMKEYREKNIDKMINEIVLNS